MKLNFGSEELKSRITYFVYDNGRKPYLICSEETYSLVETDAYERLTKVMTDFDNALMGKPKEEKYHYCGCTVFFDNTLPVGEVIIA